MIGTSLGEFLLIRISILLFRYLPALYMVVLLYNVLKRDSPWHSLATVIPALLLLAETLFFTLIYTPHKRRLQSTAIHPAPLSHTERRRLFGKCMANTPHLTEYLRGWFLGAELDDIRRDNLREFFLWAFFDAQMKNNDPASIDQDIWNEINDYVTLTEARLGHPLREGRGPAKSLRLTLDGISTAYRCLLWYLIVFLVDQATHYVLARHGFRYYARTFHVARRTFPPRPQELFAKHRSTVPELSYWLLPHTTNSGSKRSIVFWHGIGIGLWTYVWFIIQLRSSRASNHDTGIIVPEMLPISFRLTDRPPRKDQLLSMVIRILDHHQGWERFTLVSHSYGSVPTTHMLRSPQLRRRIQSITLIDPVTILLHLPNVAYNFTRRMPQRANEWQLWYFAGTDLGVALSLGRHFFWRENITWKEDLVSEHTRQTRRHDPQGTQSVAVCLSGRDLIVNTAEVARYLTSRPDTMGCPAASENTQGSSECAVDNVQVVVFPRLDHAQVFDRRRERERVVELIQNPH
ncbi:hypothetical protein J3459_013837 [Metarhizium acridum]|uniref:Alpha beta hydrolase fold family n=1 Tax=Metarhizium acridum (strain CQMa 102) TaxID=655827 RepID=E9DXM8_METAQ|nr:uncharacterized protein MAC_02376 [Metarhizium acridum CQMa 102]EFY91491.1 hypothetical protein MAC_02376 [Metarhizium acridum CQMa 102]KAG8413302.1 hypothetical protein J3458_012879 [Metarhizium acridum]KAG8416030.1 hypothetical protein J3459_013837 [Metarhizium acridum]